MKLLLWTARRTRSSPRICNACRKHSSVVRTEILGVEGNPLASPAAILREKVGPARTRFAPSPTGYLHLGSLRTALFNYLVAKATGGQFLLRIEDTDQKRTVADAEERLFRDLEWAGIEWDEGPRVGGPYGPYKQSERTALYREHAEILLQSGHAYRCFCTPERLQALAELRSKLGIPSEYDRTCTHVSKEESDDRAAKGEAHVIRLLVPEQAAYFNDLVYGVIRQGRQVRQKLPKNASVFDDPILMKTDGFPTYHLANVVDDHMMKITHVIRGSEWMNSTPRHLELYRAFNWDPPQFAHVSLLVNENHQKLSKRDASTTLAELRDELGIFPQTLNNFVALLGWSHFAKNDVMNMQQLIHNASMKYTRGDTIVALQKLWFLQKRHAQQLLPSELKSMIVQPILALLSKAVESSPQDFEFYSTIPVPERETYITSIAAADAASANFTTPSALIERAEFFFRSPSTPELEGALPRFKLHSLPPSLVLPSTSLASNLVVCFNEIHEFSKEEWTHEAIKWWLNGMIERESEISIVEYREAMGSEVAVDIGLEQMVKKAWTRLVHGYVRWAMCAGRPGMEGGAMMALLGWEECVKRLELAKGVVESLGDEDGEAEKVTGKEEEEPVI